jgi:3-hydroxyacyl-[acyl-carrier-protein] dehydratase
MRFPQARRLPAEPGSAAYGWTLGPDLMCFDGHFPGNPILPGVVQVDWACHFGQEAFGPLGVFTSIRNLKFMQIVRPGDALHLELVPGGEGALRFTYRVEDRIVSSGTLQFTKE